MKFLREIKQKILQSKWFSKLKNTKNIEIVIAVVLALVAAIAYFAISAKSKTTQPSKEETPMTQEEAKIAETISQISGVGKTRVLLTTGPDAQVVGVVVVAQGAEEMDNRIKMIRCVEKATGATVDQIEIFEMAKGG